MNFLPATLLARRNAGLSIQAPADPAIPRNAIALVSIVASTLAAGLPGLGAWSRLTPDSFTYLDAARCLYETGGYTPLRMIVPPGFPTLLAPLLSLGDLPFLAVRWMNLACWITSGAFTFLLFRRHLGTVGAWLAAVLLATSPAMSAQSAALLSEAAFMPLILGSLLLVESGRARAKTGWSTIVALGLLCAAATLVRTMGIVLAPIMGLALFLRPGAGLRHRVAETILFATVFAVPLVGWELRQSHYPRGNSYGRAWQTARPSEHSDSEGLALQIERLSRFGPMRLRDIHSALVPPRLGWRSFQGSTAAIAGWLIGGAMILVTVWRCWRVRSPVDFYCMATLGMLCFWPYDEGPRMVVPLLPFFFAYLIWAGQNAQRALAARPRASRIVTIALAGILIAHLCELGLAVPALARQREKAEFRVAAMQRIADWQDANLPPGASLAGYIRPRNDAKTTLLGGSYLARRRVIQTPRDLADPTGDALVPEVEFLFVHSESAEAPTGPNHWLPMGHVEGFDVYSRGPQTDE
ncbi:MAG TPA: glycosyltransferase family 39 protein [Phycisphaerae bacterium]|nr:glycosyltransferase family 39 protein [Phycisphaerae bacterium]